MTKQSSKTLLATTMILLLVLVPFNMSGEKAFGQVPPFNISSSPSSLTIIQGSSSNPTITVTDALGGMTLPVTLSSSSVPSGVTTSFSPSSVTPGPNPGDSATSTLTVNVGSTATPGTYTFTVTGTMGSGGPGNTNSVNISLRILTPTASTGILVPLYCTPYNTDSDCTNDGSNFAWDPINQTKNNHPRVPLYAIINPNNGFPSCTDPNVDVSAYKRGTANLTKSGVVVLGYVFTTSATRSQSAVESEIDNYKNCLPSVTGIFFDEMSNDNSATHEAYYQTLTNYAKGTDGMTYTVGNPGTSTLSGYVGTVDNIVIWERNSTPSITQLNTNTFSGTYDKHNFSFLSYAQSSLPSSSTISSDAGDVGLMYITDDGGTTDIHLPSDVQNPWDQIATYISTLAADLDQ